MIKAEAEGKALVLPTLEEMHEALETDPDEATEASKNAMGYLLNSVLPAIEPRLLKPECWAQNKSNHFDFFQKTYAHELALAMLFVGHFSDTSNIYFNQGFTDEGGKPIDAENRIQNGPKMKKRKKSNKRSNEGELEVALYQNSRFCKALAMEEGFRERMLKWDKLCCSERGAKTKSAAPLKDIVPDGFAAEDNSAKGWFSELNFFSADGDVIGV